MTTSIAVSQFPGPTKGMQIIGIIATALNFDKVIILP